MTSIYKSSINIAILLCLILLLAQTASAQTVFQGSTWSEFPGGAKAVCADDDIDNDNDGLIELCYLEDVNAIRYNLQGNTYKDSMDATGVATGCPSSGCNGYELVRDLDFDDDDSYESTSTNNVQANWTTGSGWQMIEDRPTSIVNRFIGTLEGNGHTISNLFINRTVSDNSPVGFIEDLGGSIYNLGLSDIDISITIDALLGAHSAALVGNLNYGTIANCYVQGKIKYQDRPNLLFLNSSASFVAENNGSIINSYSNVNMSVTGHRLFGMFVGFTNTGRSISDSYAIGSITHSSSFVYNHSGRLVASYTNMGGTESVYPLAQLNFGLISRSYWDSSKWGSTPDRTDGTIINSRGFSTEALQAATAPNNVDPNKPYYQWSEDNWDFGTSKQYPALRHARGNDDRFPACGTSQQPACGALLPGQSVIPVDNSRPKIAPQQDITIREGETSIVQLEVSDEDVNDELSLLLSTLDKTQDFIEFKPAKIEVSTNNQVIRAPQMLTIEGINAGEATLSLVAIDNTGIRNTTSAEVWLKVTVEANAVPEVTTPSSVTVKTGREATFNVTVSDGNVADVLTLKLTAADPDFVELVTTNVEVATNNAETRAVQTFKIKGLKEGTTTLQIVADDGLAQSQPVTVDVIVAANAVPEVTVPASVTARAGREATFNVTVSDADIDDVLTLKLTTVDPDVVELVTTNVVVATNNAETRAVQTFKITGLKEGTTTLQIVADDGLAKSQPAAVNVTVAANAVPKVTAPASVTVREGREARFNVTASDADIDDVLTLELTAANPSQDFVKLVTKEVEVETNNAETRAVQTFNIKGLKEGTTTLQIVADDGLAKSQPVTVDVIVAANAVPEVTVPSAPVTVKAGREAAFNVSVSDADIDDVLNLRLTIKAGNPDKKVVKLVTREVEVSTETRAVQTLRIKGLKEGTATLNVVVGDGVAESQPAVVNVTVERNSTPTITITPEPLDIRLLEGTSKTLWTVTATDADADDTDIRVRVRSKHSTIATAKLGAAQVSGYPLIIEAKEAGTAEIEVSANDRRGTANSESTKVFEVVVSENQAPMVVVQNVTTQVVTIGETRSLKTSEFFEDPDGDELSYEVSGFPDGYNFSFSTTTGVLMVTPGIGDASLDKDGLSVTVTATDSNGISAEAMFILLINAEPSGMPIISFNANTWQLTADTSGVSDANGIDETMTSYQWFKGETVVSTTDSNTYTIKDNNEERAGGTEYKVDVTFVDNIGQEVTTSSGVYTVDNEAPVIPAIELEEVEEGERASITTDASDANNDDLTYTWEVTSRDRDPSILEDATKTDDGQISFKVPADWVVDPSTATGVTETLQLQVTVSDGNMSATRTAEVVVTKVDNDKVDTPSISVDQANLALFTLDAINLASDSDGADEDNANINYRWQRCPANADCSLQGNWADIAATSRSLTVTDFGGVVGDKFRVKITYTDKQGYRADDFFSSTKDYTGRADIKIRAKVFLEGPLQ